MPYAHKEMHRKHCREYLKTPNGKAAHIAANRRYRQKNRLKLAAHNAVAKAVARGNLVPWPACAVPECACTEELEAHHPDYSMPLDVIWLCRTHHRQAHALVKKETSHDRPL